MVVSIRSAHRLVLWNDFLKRFAFQLEQKRDLFSSWGGEGGIQKKDENKKRREGEDLQVLLLFIKKNKKNQQQKLENPLFQF